MATYVARGDICRPERHISPQATYLASDISRSERHISPRATYVARERHISLRATYVESSRPSDISRLERHISLRATYLALSDISRGRHMSGGANICRGERHKSKIGEISCKERHISLATYLAPSDITRAERHKSRFSDICRLGRPRIGRPQSPVCGTVRAVVDHEGRRLLDSYTVELYIVPGS